MVSNKNKRRKLPGNWMAIGKKKEFIHIVFSDTENLQNAYIIGHSFQYTIIKLQTATKGHASVKRVRKGSELTEECTDLEA